MFSSYGNCKNEIGECYIPVALEFRDVEYSVPVIRITIRTARVQNNCSVTLPIVAQMGSLSRPPLVSIRDANALLVDQLNVET